MKTPVILNWSGGKDAALTLYTLLHEPEYQQQFEVKGLLSTVNAATGKTSLHGTPYSLLEQQAQAMGLPIDFLFLPDQRDYETYEQGMQEKAQYYIAQGIRHFAFGDIHLESVRSYREHNLQPLGIQLVEPLWGMGSAAVMQRFLASGLQSMIMTVNADLLDVSVVGCILDSALVAAFPDTVDCCGENGEYHSFCFSGPLFSAPVAFRKEAPQLTEITYTDSDGQSQLSRYWKMELTLHK